MAKNRRGGKSVNCKDRNNRQAGARLLEPLEGRILFSQPPLTVQPPAAFVVSAPDVTSPGGTNIAVTVQYSDSTAFNFTTFNENNITVTTPGNGTLTPTSETLNSGGTNEYPEVTYTFAAPNGSWDSTDNGVYTIATVSGSNAVSDQSATTVTVGNIGHFKVFTGGTQAGFTGGALTGDFTANSAITQSDGSYVLVGSTPIGSGGATGLVVQRYGGSGGNDYTFGADGQADIQFGAGSAGYGVVEENSGRLDIAGTTIDPSTGATDFTVFGIGASGYPDPTFGQTNLNTGHTPEGFETVDVGGSNPAAYGVALAEDGGIIAVGTTNDLGTGDFVVARINPANGLLDTGFGTNGYTTTSFGSAASAGAVVVNSADEILVAGNVGNSVVVAEYNAFGNLDPAFGTGGTVTVPGLTTSDFRVGLTLQPNGQILVGASNASGNMAVARLNTDGSVDTHFGTSGVASVAPAGATGGQVNSIVVQRGGQIVLGGIASAGGSKESVAATLNASGQPIDEFSGADYTTFATASSSDTESTALTVAPGGVVFATSNATTGTSQINKYSTDSVPPTASLTPITVTAPSASATFTITYSDAVAVDPTTIGTGNITVSDGTENLTVTSATPASESATSPLAVTYTVAAPGGAFSSADNGSYTVALTAQVKNTAGTAIAANSNLGAITVAESAAPAPVAAVTAANLTTNSSPSYSFTVQYTDALGINVATVGAGNVTVTGPNGALVVSSAVVNNDTNGSPRTVTYTVAAPHDVFSTADNGSYTIGLANTLQDVSGNPTAVNAHLGTFTINVTNAPQTSLGSFGTVAGSKKPQKLTISVNGVPTTFAVTNGSGQAYLNGTEVALTVSATTGKKAAVTITPKGGRITLGDVTVTGSVSTFKAPAADLAGTFYISGTAGTVILGNLTNATFDAAFTMSTFKAISLTNSDLLDGVQAGSDGTLGSGASYGAGVINTVSIAGPINSSVIAAGANPVNGTFGDGNDTLAGSGSMLKTITAKGGTSGTTIIESGAIKSASLPKKIKSIAADSRFRILT